MVRRNARSGWNKNNNNNKKNNKKNENKKKKKNKNNNKNNNDNSYSYYHYHYYYDYYHNMGRMMIAVALTRPSFLAVYVPKTKDLRPVIIINIVIALEAEGRCSNDNFLSRALAGVAVRRRST